MILTKESLYLKAATFDELLSNDFESVPAQKNETELGAKRLAAWCHAASGGDWNLFSKRLKRDNLKYNYVLTRFSSAKIKIGVNIKKMSLFLRRETLTNGCFLLSKVRWG